MEGITTLLEGVFKGWWFQSSFVQLLMRLPLGQEPRMDNGVAGLALKALQGMVTRRPWCCVGYACVM